MGTSLEKHPSRVWKAGPHLGLILFTLDTVYELGYRKYDAASALSNFAQSHVAHQWMYAWHT